MSKISIKAKFIDGIRWNTFSTGTILILELVRLFVLLRILTVSEFGLFALAGIVIFYIDALNDMGFRGAIIYKKINEADKLSSIYWLTVIMNALFAVIVLFLAQPISTFFKAPELVEIIQTISIIFIISGFGTIFRSVLIKEMKFKILSSIQLASTVVYFVSSIFLALKGFGVYALIYGIILKAILESICYIAFGRREFRLRLKIKFEGLGFYLKFGLYQMGERATNVIRKELDTLLIGKFLGTESLGIYSVMKNLLVRPYALINPLLTNVTLPLMSKLNSSQELLQKIYLKMINALTTVNASIYVFLAVFAPQFIMFYYGDEWQAHAISFTLIAVTFLLVSIANPVGILVVSSGQAQKGFYWNVFVLAIYAIGLFIGIQSDLFTLCLSILVCQIILFYPNYAYLVKSISGASFKDYLAMIMRPIGLMLLSIVAPWLLTYNMSPNLLTLFLAGILSVLIYIALIHKYQSISFSQIKLLLSNQR